jgi:hypothetical protein
VQGHELTPRGRIQALVATLRGICGMPPDTPRKPITTKINYKTTGEPVNSG